MDSAFARYYRTDILLSFSFMGLDWYTGFLLACTRNAAISLSLSFLSLCLRKRVTLRTCEHRGANVASRSSWCVWALHTSCLLSSELDTYIVYSNNHKNLRVYIYLYNILIYKLTDTKLKSYPESLFNSVFTDNDHAAGKHRRGGT